MSTAAGRIFVVYFGALLSGSQFLPGSATDPDKLSTGSATDPDKLSSIYTGSATDQDKLSSIYTKLVTRMRETREGYSEDQRKELNQGLSMCRKKMMEGMLGMESSSNSNKDLIGGVKMCVVKEILKFFYLHNEDLGVSREELLFLKLENDVKPFTHKYSTGKEEIEIETTIKYVDISTTTESASVDPIINSRIEESNFKNTDENVADENTSITIRSINANDNMESESIITDISSKNADESVDGDSIYTTTITSTNNFENMDTIYLTTKISLKNDNGNMDSDSTTTEINPKDAYGNISIYTLTTMRGNVDDDSIGTKINSKVVDEFTESDSKPTEASSTNTDGIMEMDFTSQKYNSTDTTQNVEIIWNSTIASFTINDFSNYESTEISSMYSDGNIDKLSSSTKPLDSVDNLNSTDLNKQQNESFSRLSDTTSPIFLDSLLSKILSGIFGVLISMTIVGTIIGCCFIYKINNFKKQNDDQDPLEDSDESPDDVSLDVYSSKPCTPVGENAPDLRMVTTPLLVGQIDNLNQVSQQSYPNFPQLLQPHPSFHHHHLQSPQFPHHQQSPFPHHPPPAPYHHHYRQQPDI